MPTSRNASSTRPIELRVREIGQLFHSLDPLPYRERDLFRVGRTALLAGLAVLATCVVLGRLLSERLGAGYLGRFFQEGLIILGWVANWRPIQIFLYDR